MRANWIPRAVLASLLALLASGCFVMDEMDKSAKLDNSYSAPGAKPPAKGDAAGAAAKAAAPGPAKAGAPGAQSAAKPAGPQGKAWWRTASSVTSEEGDTSIGRCAIDGRVEFSKRDECIARGGKPQ